MSHYLFHLTFNKTLRERNAFIILQIGTLRLRAGNLPESPSSAGAARGSFPRPTWQTDCVPSPDSASPSIQRCLLLPSALFPGLDTSRWAALLGSGHRGGARDYARLEQGHAMVKEQGLGIQILSPDPGFESCFPAYWLWHFKLLVRFL